MSLDVHVEKITKENLPSLMPELLRLEHEWVGIGDTAWSPENFMSDLPGKWEMSEYASVYGTLVAYHIASIDGTVGKLNKILVDSNFRGQGIGDRLWKEFIADCRSRELERAEFKVLTDNFNAICFYRNRGCLFNGEVLGSDSMVRYVVVYPFRLKDTIPHSKPTITSDDKDAIVRAVEEGDLATGKVVGYLSDAFSGYIGKKHGIATSSGSAALHLALRALDVKQGDEVILPSYVCNAVLNSVKYCNATPVLADINSDDYNISYDDTKRKLTGKTKAIIVPHMFGKPVRDLEQFISLDVPVIEDCALSVGASYKGKKLGSFGSLSMFSFRATKVMAAGLGGMILTDDDSLFDRLQSLTTYDNRLEAGESYNYQMPDINAALALNQLKKLDAFIAARRNVARKYYNMFKMSKVDFEFPEVDDDNIFFRYIIRHSELEGLMENVKGRGVDFARPVFMPLHRYLNLPDTDFPNTNNAYKTALSLPIYPLLDPLIEGKKVQDVAGVLVNWRYEK